MQDDHLQIFDRHASFQDRGCDEKFVFTALESANNLFAFFLLAVNGRTIRNEMAEKTECLFAFGNGWGENKNRVAFFLIAA